MVDLSHEAPITTHVFYALPDSLQTSIINLFRTTDSDLAALLMFYFGERCILRETGWLESQQRGYPVDGNGQPVPWYTTGAVEYLDGRIHDSLSVFEYGSGNSTLWYGQRVGHVTAVEHDESWATKMKSQAPQSVDVHHRSVGCGYTTAVEDSGPYDIVVVDGEERPKCARAAIDNLTRRGVVIWDDYEDLPTDYYGFLLEDGFDVLPFFGLKRLCDNMKATAIFYREENCLDI